MELQQLRYVVEVADASSFTRAAERCFVTQSALSHQIAALERELGLRLFARSSRHVRLTEAGSAFLHHARIAVAAAGAAREDAAAAEGRVVGTVRLGVIPTVGAVDIPSLIARFRALHPQVRVELTVGNSESLTRAIRADDLDVAFLGLHADTPPVGVGMRRLALERLVVAVPAQHSLGQRAEVQLAELQAEVFADFPAGTSGRAQGDTAFAAAALTRDVAFEADSAELLLGLVACGLALCLLSPGAVVRSHAQVVPVRVSDGPLRAEYAVWHELAPRAATRAFLTALDAELATCAASPTSEPVH